jgi:hypothetical protein
MEFLSQLLDSDKKKKKAVILTDNGENKMMINVDLNRDILRKNFN